MENMGLVEFAMAPPPHPAIASTTGHVITTAARIPRRRPRVPESAGLTRPRDLTVANSCALRNFCRMPFETDRLAEQINQENSAP
jgi:hypothetical protein